MYLSGALLVICIVGIASSCKCPARVHNQELFCRKNSYSVFGRVRRVIPRGLENQINVEVLVPFKGPLVSGRTQRIFTPTSSCGIDVSENQYYLFSGTISSGGKLQISLCDWVSNWRDLNSCEKRHLFEKNYENSCDCKVQIKTCPPGVDCSEVEIPPNVCEFFPNQTRLQDGFCGLYGPGECFWNPCYATPVSI